MQLKRLFLSLSASAALWLPGCPGCARFSSHQVKLLSDGTRIEQSQHVTTFFDGKSDIAKLRASTTEATQGLTVGGISQETSGTNAVDLVERVVNAAVRAAVKP